MGKLINMTIFTHFLPGDCGGRWVLEVRSREDFEKASEEMKKAREKQQLQVWSVLQFRSRLSN